MTLEEYLRQELHRLEERLQEKGYSKDHCSSLVRGARYFIDQLLGRF